MRRGHARGAAKDRGPYTIALSDGIVIHSSDMDV
jgi:hypothetical protein